jgi:hypothetical protein
MMSDFVSSLLGEKEVERICKREGVSDEGKKIVKKILEAWEGAGLNTREKCDQVKEKIHLAMNILSETKNLTNKEIMSAIIVINAEFVTEVTR